MLHLRHPILSKIEMSLEVSVFVAVPIEGA